MGRRQFVHRIGITTLGSGTLGTSDGTGNRRDDRGDPIGLGRTVTDTVAAVGQQLVIAPSTVSAVDTPGTIRAPHAWVTPGAPATGNRYALRIQDNGGVDPGFRFTTSGDLTIDTHFRFHTGWSTAYLFNDADSFSAGFRVFTNGQARNGLFFRNPFGGDDFGVSRNIQDGRWHWFRLILDADAGRYRAFLDGDLVGDVDYHGDGWTARSQFRVMGRRTGSFSWFEYDRFVMTDEAVYPETADAVTSSLLHYELEDGGGRSLENGALVRVDDLVAEKRALIERIRTVGGELLPADRAGQLDAAAAAIVDAIEEPAGNELEAGFTRLIAAESVTHTATQRGTVASRRLARTVVDLAHTVAASRVAARGLRGAGWAARRLRNILRDVAGRASRGIQTIFGRRRPTEVGVDRIESVVAAIAADVATFRSEFDDELLELGEKLVELPIKATVEHAPVAATDQLESAQTGATTGIATAVFDRFQFAVDAESTSARPGIDRAIEMAVQPIGDDLGSIQWDRPVSAVDDLRDEAIDSINRTVDGAMAVVDAMESAAGMTGTMGVVIGVLALGAFFAAAVAGGSGVGLLVGGAAAAVGVKLKAYAAILGGISGTLSAGAGITGIAALAAVRSTHYEAVMAILGTEVVA